MRLRSLLLVSTMLGFACGAGGGDDANPSGVITSIRTQRDADRAAVIITQTWDQGVDTFESGERVYTDHVVAGLEGGTVTINGRYRNESLITNKKVFEFDAVSFTYDNYLEDKDYSSMTGTAYANGSIYVESSSYSGRWNLEGSVDLAPSSNPTIQGYQFDCSVDFAFSFASQYSDYVGKIFFEGTEWDVNSL